MTNFDFEEQIVEIEHKIDELKHISKTSGLNMNDQIEHLEKQAYDYKYELYMYT